jgi:hypothetical protein
VASTPQALAGTLALLIAINCKTASDQRMFPNSPSFLMDRRRFRLDHFPSSPRLGGSHLRPSLQRGRRTRRSCPRSETIGYRTSTSTSAVWKGDGGGHVRTKIAALKTGFKRRLPRVATARPRSTQSSGISRNLATMESKRSQVSPRPSRENNFKAANCS